MIRRVALGAILVVLVVGAGLAWMVWQFGLSRSTAGGAGGQLQDWIGRQLLAIANDHLGPDLAFDSLDYQGGLSVVLTDVNLSTPEQELITVERMTVDLAERPRRGQPLRIAGLSFEYPIVHLVARQEGGLVGFANFIESDGGERDADGGSSVLSDVLRFERVEVSDGALEYVPLEGDVMYLDDISLAFDGDAVDERPGAYVVDGGLERDPVGSVRLNGILDLDTAHLEIEALELRMDLAVEDYGMLPPPVQRLLREHELAGSLKVKANGIVPLADAAASDLDLTLDLADGRYAWKDWVLAIDDLRAQGSLSKSTVHVNDLRAKFIGGTLDLSGSLGFQGARPFAFDAQAVGLRIEQLLREAGDQRFAGIATFDLNGQGRLGDDGRAELAGGGSLHVDEGRFVGDPILGGVVRAMGMRDRSARETLDSKIELRSDQIGFRDIQLDAPPNAARGEGEVYFDRNINFRFNAGPLERVQGMLGRVGQVFGQVTDKLVTYQVTGTLDKPVFEVRPLGIGVVPGEGD